MNGAVPLLPPQAFMGLTEIILDFDCTEFIDCPTDFTLCAQFQNCVTQQYILAPIKVSCHVVLLVLTCRIVYF
jgi:hypothetical protein